MDIKTEYGEDIFCLPPVAFCKIARKDIEDLESCPICNFDDIGDICCPSICEHYTETMEEGE